MPEFARIFNAVISVTSSLLHRSPGIQAFFAHSAALITLRKDGPAYAERRSSSASDKCALQLSALQQVEASNHANSGAA